MTNYHSKHLSLIKGTMTAHMYKYEMLHELWFDKATPQNLRALCIIIVSTKKSASAPLANKQLDVL